MASHDQSLDLTYATHDGVALAGDLYVPAGNGPFPALVAVHGGGWIQGARSQFQYWGPHLAERGIARTRLPERLVVVAEMPMTPTRKIIKGRLAAAIANLRT